MFREHGLEVRGGALKPVSCMWNHLKIHMKGSLKMIILQIYIPLQPVTRSYASLSWLYGLEKQNSSIGIWVRSPHLARKRLGTRLVSYKYSGLLVNKRLASVQNVDLTLKRSTANLSFVPESDKVCRTEIKLCLMEIKFTLTLVTGRFGLCLRVIQREMKTRVLIIHNKHIQMYVLMLFFSVVRK